MDMLSACLRSPPSSLPASCLTRSPTPARHHHLACVWRLMHVSRVFPLVPAKVGKEISKTEIPPFIPRPDLLDQLVRWALAWCTA